MNYGLLYTKLIESARRREKRKDIYTERHHIIPKSMGGNDNKKNIVDLTAREHFIAHWLLYKIHRNVEMSYAFFAMTKMGNSYQRRYTSHNFRFAREAMAKVMRERRGDKHPLYGLKKEENPNYGSKRNKGTRCKLSDSASKRVGALNPRSRPVVNIELGHIFNTIKEAQLAFGGNVLYAIKSGGTAGGYHYRYLENLYSNSLKGYARGSGHPRAKKIVNITTGEVFETVREAASSIGVTPPAISWAIKNNRLIKSFLFKGV